MSRSFQTSFSTPDEFDEDVTTLTLGGFDGKLNMLPQEPSTKLKRDNQNRLFQ